MSRKTLRSRCCSPTAEKPTVRRPVYSAFPVLSLTPMPSQDPSPGPLGSTDCSESCAQTLPPPPRHEDLTFSLASSSCLDTMCPGGRLQPPPGLAAAPVPYPSHPHLLRVRASRTGRGLEGRGPCIAHHSATGRCLLHTFPNPGPPWQATRAFSPSPSQSLPGCLSSLSSLIFTLRFAHSPLLYGAEPSTQP